MNVSQAVARLAPPVFVAAALALGVTKPAIAQDLLAVDDRMVGAIGGFGADLGLRRQKRACRSLGAGVSA